MTQNGRDIKLIEDYVVSLFETDTSGHDWLHIERVKNTAIYLAHQENIENTNYLYQLTQYISKDTPEGAAIDVGFIKQYLESSCKTRHAALRIFPMAIDKTTADCSKIAHIIGNKKIKFDLNYKSTFANLSPEVIHR
jgi:hypothetical protein